MGEQPVVGNHDQGVDLLAELGDPCLGLHGPDPSLESEGSGHDPNGQGTQIARDIGNDWRTTRPGAATLARGDEDHVGALQGLLDDAAILLGRAAPDLRVAARAEPTGELLADVELELRVTHEQRLGVGVDGDELHAFEAGVDHPVDGVDAATADADDLDDGQVVLGCEGHGFGCSLLRASHPPWASSQSPIRRRPCGSPGPAG